MLGGPDLSHETPGFPEKVLGGMLGDKGVVLGESIRVGGIVKCRSQTRKSVLCSLELSDRRRVAVIRCMWSSNPSARARCKDLGICAHGIQSSATRKHKCLVGGVRPVVSHESEEPRRSNTPGFFLGNAHGIHSSHASSVRVDVAWRRPAQRHIQFPKER